MFPVTIIAPSQETELFLNNRWTFTKPIDEKKNKLHSMSSPMHTCSKNKKWGSTVWGQLIHYIICKIPAEITYYHGHSGVNI